MLPIAAAPAAFDVSCPSPRPALRRGSGLVEFPTILNPTRHRGEFPSDFYFALKSVNWRLPHSCHLRRVRTGGRREVDRTPRKSTASTGTEIREDTSTGR